MPDVDYVQDLLPIVYSKKATDSLDTAPGLGISSFNAIAVSVDIGGGAISLGIAFAFGLGPRGTPHGLDGSSSEASTEASRPASDAR